MTFYSHNQASDEKAISYDKDFSPGDAQLDVTDSDAECTGAEINGNPAYTPSGQICKDTNYISLRARAVCDSNNNFTTDVAQVVKILLLNTP